MAGLEGRVTAMESSSSLFMGRGLRPRRDGLSRCPRASQGQLQGGAGSQCLFSLLILQAPGQLHPEIVDKFTILGLTSAVSNKQQI